MDCDKAIEKFREAVLGELKVEFREFRSAVTGELAGFRLAIESISARQTAIENELRQIWRSIDETISASMKSDQSSAPKLKKSGRS